MSITYPPEMLPRSEDEADVIAECDCCGKQATVTRCWPMGMETFACDECRGGDGETARDTDT